MLAGSLLFWIAALALLGSVFTSLAANALYFHTPARLEQTVRDGQLAEALGPHLPKLDRFLFTTVVLNLLSDLVFITATGTYALLPMSEGPVPWASAAITFAIASFVILVLGEVVPRAFAEAYADRLLPRLLPSVALLDWVSSPLIAPLHLVHDAIVGWVSEPVTREQIADEIRSTTLEAQRENLLNEEDATMIESIIELREGEVREIMTPRTDMVCLEKGSSLEEALSIIVAKGHSRIPVYDGSRDRIVGLLYAKDLLRLIQRDRDKDGDDAQGTAERAGLPGLLRRPFFVPVTKPIGDLLKEFRARKVHIAIVLDEYGGTAGLVTIEDILEEIVGEIADEHEGRTPEDVVKITDSAATVEGRTHIDDLNDALGIDVPEAEDYETVGGLLFTRLGRVPSTGEHYDIDGIRFTVLEADERRINRVKVTVSRDAG